MLVDFADCSTHNTGNGGWPLWVGNQQHVGGELALYAIEGRHFLARMGTAHDDMLLAYKIIVEAMKWLTELQHHIVGDIYDVVDWPHTRCKESPPHPFR